jgi:regulator of protease activity HflC (stomatin/prohibitin superfamily)
MPLTPIAVLLAALPLALLLVSLRRVPEGQVYTVHRLGRYSHTLTPGLHLVWPWIDRVAHQVCLIGHHVELPMRPLGASSARADLYYQILDPVRTGNVLDDVDAVVLRQADAVLSEVAEQARVQESGLAALAEACKAELNRRIGQMGLRIIRCSLHPAG